MNKQTIESNGIRVTMTITPTPTHETKEEVMIHITEHKKYWYKQNFKRSHTKRYKQRKQRNK